MRWPDAEAGISKEDDYLVSSFDLTGPRGLSGENDWFLETNAETAVDAVRAVVFATEVTCVKGEDRYTGRQLRGRA